MSTATLSPFASRAVVSGEGYEKCPAGNHAGWLIALIDGGTHVEMVDRDAKDDEGKVIFGADGKPKQVKVPAKLRKLYFYWELTGKKDSSGRPFIVGDRVNWSDKMSEKAAGRKMVEKWRGSSYPDGVPIDPTELVDVPCMVNVVQKKVGEKIYVNVAGIAPLPEEMVARPRTRLPVFFHLSMGEPPDLAWLPYVYGEPVADVIRRSEERGGSGKRPDSAPATGGDDAKRKADLDTIESLAGGVLNLDKAHPSAVRCADQIRGIMKETGLEYDDLGESGKELLLPF